MRLDTTLFYILMENSGKTLERVNVDGLLFNEIDLDKRQALTRTLFRLGDLGVHMLLDYKKHTASFVHAPASVIDAMKYNTRYTYYDNKEFHMFDIDVTQTSPSNYLFPMFGFALPLPTYKMVPYHKGLIFELQTGTRITSLKIANMAPAFPTIKLGLSRKREHRPRFAYLIDKAALQWHMLVGKSIRQYMLWSLDIIYSYLSNKLYFKLLTDFEHELLEAAASVNPQFNVALDFMKAWKGSRRSGCQQLDSLVNLTEDEFLAALFDFILDDKATFTMHDVPTIKPCPEVFSRMTKMLMGRLRSADALPKSHSFGYYPDALLAIMFVYSAMQGYLQPTLEWAEPVREIRT